MTELYLGPNDDAVAYFDDVKPTQIPPEQHSILEDAGFDPEYVTENDIELDFRQANKPLQVTETDLVQNKNWISNAAALMPLFGGRERNPTAGIPEHMKQFGSQEPAMADDEVAQWGLEFMGWFNYNLPTMGYSVAAIQSAPQEQKEALLNLVLMYDKKKIDWNGTKRMFLGVVADPSSYVGLTTLGFGAAAGYGARQGTKAGFIAALKASLPAARVGAIEGAVYAVGDNALQQEVKIEGGVQQEHNYTDSLISAGTGLAAGAGFTTLAGQVPGLVRSGVNYINETAKTAARGGTLFSGVPVAPGVVPDAPVNPADVRLPLTDIKMPRKKAHAPTEKELGVIQTISTTPAEAQLAVDTISRIRATYPVGKGREKFAPIELTGGKFDKDGKFIPTIKKQAYAFTPPAGVDKKTHQTKISNAMVSDVEKIVARANTGDQAAVDIISEARWYRDMRVRIRSEFGGLGDLFADLLGTTSAQTNVRQNFTNAIEIMRRFTRGEFDGEIAAWERRAASGESMNPTVLQKMHKTGEFPLITSSAGKLFNANSPASMKALLDTFRDIKKGVAPKTPNFTGNLIGFSNRATVDVWAGRYIRNKAGLAYIPPPAEQAVSGEHKAGSTFDNPEVGAEFGFGQDVFAQAANKLNNRGTVQKYDPNVGKIGADDLQAIVWFMEKEKWTKNGWTTKAGEGGSLDLEASFAGAADQGAMNKLRDQASAEFKPPKQRKKETDEAFALRVQDLQSAHAARVQNAAAGVEETARPVDRFTAGVSAARPGSVPSNQTQAEMADVLTAPLREDKSVITLKSNNTYGNFAGVNERALDVEFVVRGDFNPTKFENALVQTGKDKDQDAVFISKVIQSPTPENTANANPGLELYFTKTKKAQFATVLADRLREEGLDGFTFITDARQSGRVDVQAGTHQATAGITGLRLQYIPEFKSKPTPEMRQKMEDIFDDLAVEYTNEGFISSANVVYSETKVWRRATDTDWMSGGMTYDEYFGE